MNDQARLKHLASVVRAKLHPSAVRHEGRCARPPFFFLGSDRLAGRLGADQPVVCFAVGTILHDRPSIAVLAEHFYQEVRKIQPEGPYFLGGFCFWGMVAYEVACKLVSAGEAVGLLVLAEAPYPGRLFHRLRPLRRLLLALNRPALLLRHLARGRAAAGPSATAAALLDDYLERMRHAQKGYTPSSYNGSISLICGDESPYRFFPAAGWRWRVTGRLDVRIARGDHSVSLFENREICEILTSMLAPDVAAV
jgi:thioesterase domain-containing protein